MTQLALLRHGHTEWNRQGRIQGRTDIPLDAQTVEDLSGRRLPEDWRGATLAASPLTRATQTAELVADRAPQVIPALIEMDWGDWEGQRGVDLLAAPDIDYRPIEAWGWHYAPPNGESLHHLRRRVLPWVLGLSQNTLAVTHIGVMRVILACATGWDFSGPAPFKIKRNRLYVIAVANGVLTLQPAPLPLEWRASCG